MQQPNIVCKPLKLAELFTQSMGGLQNSWISDTFPLPLFLSPQQETNEMWYFSSAARQKYATQRLVFLPLVCTESNTSKETWSCQLGSSNQFIAVAAAAAAAAIAAARAATSLICLWFKSLLSFTSLFHSRVSPFFSPLPPLRSLNEWCLQCLERRVKDKPVTNWFCHHRALNGSPSWGGQQKGNKNPKPDWIPETGAWSESLPT